MSDELFDVVDENDKITGRKSTKEAVHKDGTLHRAIAVYVFDRTGNLYIQNHHSGLYDHSVGGHISSGEDYLQAAIREMEEEIGLKNVHLETIALSVYSNEQFNPKKQKSRQRHMFGIFECDAPIDWVFEPNDEVEGLFAQSLKKTIQQMNTNPSSFTPGFINTMVKYLEIKKLPLKFDIEQVRKNWGEL